MVKLVLRELECLYMRGAPCGGFLYCGGVSVLRAYQIVDRRLLAFELCERAKNQSLSRTFPLRLGAASPSCRI